MTKPEGMDAADVVERAQTALEGVTEGPWEVTGGVVWCATVIAVPDPMDETGQTPMPELIQEKICDSSQVDAPFIAAARSLVPELVAELRATRAELALTRDGLDVRPMTECESNLMTQVLDLRRQLAAARGSVGEVHP